MSRSLLGSVLASLALSFSVAAGAGCAGRAAPGARGASVGAAASEDGSEPADPQARRAAVRTRLAAQRAVQLERLRAYRAAGEFPRQRLEPDDRVNLLVDDDGTLAAVASLMEQAGLGELVRVTAAHSNTLRLFYVQDGPLVAWILESGLTKEEVDLIQEPYAFDTRNPTARERERQRLVDQLVQVEARLERDAEASLDLATDRLLVRLERQERASIR